MWKGATASQHCPSKESRASADGTSGLRTSAETGQCANSRSFQVCTMIHGPEGTGQGRWSRDLSAECTDHLLIWHGWRQIIGAEGSRIARGPEPTGKLFSWRVACPSVCPGCPSNSERRPFTRMHRRLILLVLTPVALAQPVFDDRISLKLDASEADAVLAILNANAARQPVTERSDTKWRWWLRKDMVAQLSSKE